jgi:peptidoglycan hydrolase FlgJ
MALAIVAAGNASQALRNIYRRPPEPSGNHDAEVPVQIKPVPPGSNVPAMEPASAMDRAMRDAAQAFEATYLAEMLKQSGVNSMPDAFGGGAGEDAFSGLLTGEYARLLAERGGIGLAEQIFEAIKGRSASE